MSYPMDRFEYDNICVSEELDFLREENERLKQENEKMRASIKASIKELHDGVADQVRRDTIDECIEKLYEVTPKTADQKLDMVFVDALEELKEQK